MTITLPGDIPGLLRQCSLVYHDTYGRGVVLFVTGNDARVAFGDMGAIIEVAPATLVLVLTDATGRARATWWLADRLRLDPSRGCIFTSAPVGFAWVLFGYGHGGRPRDNTAWFRGGPRGEPRDVIVPGLESLNRGDPRLLPDGSRVVDAKALELVCLHVAGRSG